MWTQVRTYASFVRFSHSVFALPFALTGALLAARTRPVGWAQVCWIVVAMVAARSAAMGFNRLADAAWDARNPRTAMREIPRGVAVPRAGSHLRGGGVGRVRAGGVAARPGVRGPLARSPSPSSSGTRSPSATRISRRRSWASPWRSRRSAGGWRQAGAAAGNRGWLGLAIGLWVGGFDVLYACQDLEFDRAHGLRSIPVRFGVPGSLAISRAMHVATVLAMAAIAIVAPLGPIYLAGVAAVAALLVYEQSLVSATDLSQVKRAFDLNGYVGLLYFAVTATAVFLR